MKYLPVLAFTALSACMQTAARPSVTNPGLPPLSCTVANFTSDTGDAAFMNGNVAKTFTITSTGDGFSSTARSDVFSDSTTDFAVTTVTATQIEAIDRARLLGSSLRFTMVAERTPTNGVYRVVQTMQVDNSDVARGFTQNQWTLACRANR